MLLMTCGQHGRPDAAVNSTRLIGMVNGEGFFCENFEVTFLAIRPLVDITGAALEANMAML
jgi:hypothetical protein